MEIRFRCSNCVPNFFDKPKRSARFQEINCWTEFSIEFLKKKICKQSYNLNYVNKKRSLRHQQSLMTLSSLKQVSKTKRFPSLNQFKMNVLCSFLLVVGNWIL